MLFRSLWTVLFILVVCTITCIYREAPTRELDYPWKMPLMPFPLNTIRRFVLKRNISSHRQVYPKRAMGKNRAKIPGEEYMHLPAHPSYSASISTPIVDTHTHLISTFAIYRQTYPTSQYETVFDFVRGMYCSQTPPPDVQGRVSIRPPRHNAIQNGIFFRSCFAP